MVNRITPEQRALYNERARVRAAEKALAAGRTPGKKGQPPKNRTPEEKAALHRERTRRYYFDNHEKMKMYRAEWARKKAAESALSEGRLPGVSGVQPLNVTDAERKAKQTARGARYYYENIEKCRAQAAKRERDRRAAKKAGTHVPFQKKSAEHLKAVDKAASHARRARLVNAGAAPTASEIRSLRWRQNGICPCCNMLLGPNVHLDHWVPLKRKGTNAFDNLRLLHDTCNLKKGTKHPDELRQPYEIAAA